MSHKLISKKSTANNLEAHLAAIISAVIACACFAFFHRWAYDDPYITFRYAYNLAHGQGFTYNPGQPTLSTTTPLFTLLLALLALPRIYIPAWPDIPIIANLLGALSLGAGGWLLWQMGRAESRLQAWCGLLLYPTFSQPLLSLGSEIPFYITCCLGTIAAYTHKPQACYRLAALWAALAALTRPDGVLVLASLLVIAWYNHARQGNSPDIRVGLQVGSIFLLLVLPWVIFAWAYFGSPIPLTLAAKQRQASMPISQSFVAGFLTTIQGYVHNWPYRLEAALAALGLLWDAQRCAACMSGAACTPGAAHRDRAIPLRSTFILLLWSGLYFAAYTVLGVSRYFWYYAPLTPALIVSIGLGLQALHHFFRCTQRLRCTQRQCTSLPAPLKHLLAITPAAILILLAGFQARDAWKLSRWVDPRYPPYRQTGEWLQQNTPSNASVGLLEIGVTGYYAQRPIIDFGGLLQPDIAQQLTPTTTYEDAATWAAMQYQPDYIVLKPGALPLFEQNFLPQCQRIPWSAGLDIYHCQ